MEEAPPEWTKGPVRRPVDIGDSFHESGMYLITDPRSDKYLERIRKKEESET
jgi:hypothetical protein